MQALQSKYYLQYNSVQYIEDKNKQNEITLYPVFQVMGSSIADEPEFVN